MKAYLQDFAASAALLAFIIGLYLFASGLEGAILAARACP